MELPLRIPLRGPSRREMVDHFEELRNWIERIRRAAGRAGFDIEWRTVNHRQLGRNEIPAAVRVPDLERYARFAGDREQLDRFRALAAQLRGRLPEVLDWVHGKPFALLEHEEALERLIRFVEWLRAHPPAGMYLRQVDLPGIDTKFLEAHTGVLSAWLDRVLPESRIDRRYGAGKTFEDRYGFSRKPELFRFRLLDPELEPAFGGFSDLSVPAAELAATPMDERGVETLIVVENDISALALPQHRAAVALFGRGYAFQGLSDARWLQRIYVRYWGDIDTHGFAILSEFRRIVPHARSMLMDRDTFLAHREHWSQEPSRSRGTPANLTKSERALYDELAGDTHGASLRLEQERVRFGAVRKRIEGGEA
jgi:hypothetical protein